MEHTLNNEFEAKVKTLVEGLGYSLNGNFDSTDKGAFIMPISELNKLYSENRDTNPMPHIVITFRSSFSEELRCLAIVLFDTAQINSGIIKLIDASFCFTDTPFLQNLIYHQAYPGDDRLKYPGIYEDAADDMQDHWDEYVQTLSYVELEKNNYSWFPNDYSKLPMKEGFYLKKVYCCPNIDYILYDPEEEFNNFCDKYFAKSIEKDFLVGKIIFPEDLKDSQIDYTLVAADIPSDRKDKGKYLKIENKKVVAVSLSGSLRPTLIDAEKDVVYVPLSDMAVIDMEDIDAEYLIKELQKDYVTDQIEAKQRSVINDREYILSLIKIYIPLDSHGQSSIDKQKERVQKELNTYVKYLEEELERERAKYLKKYKDVCDYCKKESLKRLLIKLEKDEISNDPTIFNEVRQLLEWVKEKSPAYLSKYKHLPLNAFSTTIAGNMKIDNTPEYIVRSFHTCVSLGNIGSHHNEEVQLGEHLENAPYLAKSVIYSLLNILYWCKDLDMRNKNV